MGIMICKRKSRRQLTLDEEIQQRQIDQDIRGQNLNDSHIENNDDGYFTDEEYRQYQHNLHSFDLNQQNGVNDHTRKFKWTNTNQILGSGASGQVYQGLNPRGQLIAVKQVLLQGYQIPDNEKRIRDFELEIDILSRLNHGNIVKYFGMERDDRYIYLFMEYVAGGSITSLLHKFGKLKENLIQTYVWQILNGLEYLHSHGIIHRDIKGANLLVDEDGVCKLADFGSCKKLTEILQKEQYKTLIGTINWMAPEVMKQTGHGRFADIWSLGCTIIEMATGKPPWFEVSQSNQYLTMLEILKCEKPPKIPEDLSSEAKSFLEKCLKINPKERWNVNKLKAHPWIQAVKLLEGNQSGSNSSDFQRIQLKKQENSKPVRQTPILSIQVDQTPVRESSGYQEVIAEESLRSHGQVSVQISDKKSESEVKVIQSEDELSRIEQDGGEKIVHNQINTFQQPEQRFLPLQEIIFDSNDISKIQQIQYSERDEQTKKKTHTTLKANS